MPDQKISELSAITAIDNATDVLPIVDTSATTTKKITLTQVKTSLALNNVDNTSDANKPVSSATQTALDAKQATLVSGTNIKTVNNTSLLGSGNIAISSAVAWGGVTGTLSNQTDLQTALDAKVDENTAITGATKTKITYDAKGLVTAGADATTADIASSTDKRYITDAQLVVVGNTSGTNTGDNANNSQYSGLAASKQDTLISATNIKTINSTSVLGSGDIAVQATLVSGTNIKTINSTSLLGSGDIVIGATPSGVAGAIQFSNGSAFASDAANLFWDDSNNRLGVGTNAPSVPFEVLGNAWVNAVASADATFSIGNPTRRWDVKALQSGAYYQVVYNNGLIGQSIDFQGNVAFGNVATLGARVGIKGSGSTSATTSLLVQNSSGVTGLTVFDNGNVAVGSVTAGGFYQLYGNGTWLCTGSIGTNQYYLSTMSPNAGGSTNFYGNLNNFKIGTSATATASAVFEVDSTTKGFLPPRMTTTQKNAIASPAAGLVVYDNTTNKLQCYNGSSWNDLF